MTVDPRVGFYLSILLAIIGAVAGASTQLTTIFGEHTATVVLAWAVLVLTVGNAVNAVLHAIPSKPGAANEFPLGPKT
jgi:MFS superfamily sulfate permease-like transporter